MSKTQANWRKIPSAPFLSAMAQSLRTYVKEVEDGRMTVVVAKEEGIGCHMSISHTTRYPTWDEISAARDQFTPPEVTMVMLLPPRNEWVNLHNNCFHLWEERKS